MTVLANTIAVFLMVIGLIALLPLVFLGFGLIAGLLGFLIWVLPFVIIATSRKTTGGEKILWLLAMVLLSWFAWIFYFLFAPLAPKTEARRLDYPR